MADTMTEDEKRAHLREVMASFDTAMLVTHTSDGHLRARPLALAEQQDDGLVYFATAVDSPKVHEIETDARVNVTMQDKRRFVSLSGIARVTRDRALVDRLWSEAWKVWFPKGKDDPSLCLLAVEPMHAEYWDNKGVQGLAYLFEAARATWKGERPRTDDARNAKVDI
jgi:general stress protein 26